VTTLLSLDGGNNAKTDRACCAAKFYSSSLHGVGSVTLAEAREAAWHGPVAVERIAFDGRDRRNAGATSIGLAWNTAAVAYTLAAGAPVHEYLVKDWIGTTTKQVLHQRIWATLTDVEREALARAGRKVLGPRKRGPAGSGAVADVERALEENTHRGTYGKDLLLHDWYDPLCAAGVGLFHLGRIKKGGARP
jgi:hypothetical protein